MRILFCIALGLLPLKASDDPRWVVYEPGEVEEAGGGGRHIVLVSGDEEYRSEEALPMLGQILARRHGFRCTVLFAQNPETGVIDPDNQAHIPGLAVLGDADMLVLFTRFRRLPDADMKHIVDFVESGKPVLGLRTATHAFNYEADSKSPYAHWSFRSKSWPGGFGRQILGETWIRHHGHHGRESTRGLVPEASRAHPVVRGVEDVWGPTDVYGVTELPEGATVLLNGSVRAGMTHDAPAVDGPRNAPMHPVAWARELPREAGSPQRIVCSTIAAAIDLASEDLRRLMVNACYWGLRLPVPEGADVRPLTPYKPTMYGFGGYVRDMRPVDHALSPEDPR